MTEPDGYIVGPTLYRRFIEWLRNGGDANPPSDEESPRRFLTCVFNDEDQNADGSFPDYWRPCSRIKPGRGLHRIIAYVEDESETPIDTGDSISLTIGGQPVDIQTVENLGFIRLADVRRSLEGQGFDVKYARPNGNFFLSILVDVGLPIEPRESSSRIKCVVDSYSLTVTNRSHPGGGESLFPPVSAYYFRHVWGVSHGYIWPGRGFIPVTSDSLTYSP